MVTMTEAKRFSTGKVYIDGTRCASDEHEWVEDWEVIVCLRCGWYEEKA